MNGSVSRPKAKGGMKYKLDRVMHMPKSAERYEMRKLQTMIKLWEKVASSEGIRNLSLSDYTKLLARHTVVVKEVMEIERKRVSAKVSAQTGSRATRKRASFGVDIGVPAIDPFAEDRESAVEAVAVPATAAARQKPLPASKQV